MDDGEVYRSTGISFLKAAQNELLSPEQQ